MASLRGTACGECSLPSCSPRSCVASPAIKCRCFTGCCSQLMFDVDDWEADKNAHSSEVVRVSSVNHCTGMTVSTAGHGETVSPRRL